MPGAAFFWSHVCGRLRASAVCNPIFNMKKTTKTSLRSKVPYAKRGLARLMRCDPTPSEAAAWRLLRARRMMGLRFQRQVVLRGYIADFYCAAHKLVVELDGGYHQLAKDRMRDAHLQAVGIRTIRIRVSEFEADHSVLQKRIAAALSSVL